MPRLKRLLHLRLRLLHLRLRLLHLRLRDSPHGKIWWHGQGSKQIERERQKGKELRLRAFFLLHQQLK
jgi:hypothetical protein